MPDEPRDPLADLLRTPVATGRRGRSETRSRRDDQPAPGPAPHWVILLGMALGILAVVVGYLVAAGGDGVDGAATTTTGSTTTTVVANGSNFPDGYAAVTELVAIHPEAIVTTPDRIIVAFATAVRRGFDPDLSTPFQGGDFTLVYPDGTTPTAEQLIFDPRAPGVFSVAFPPPPAGTGPPEGISLTSTWTRRSLWASVPLDATSVPYVLLEPLSIGFDGGSSITIDTLTFDGTGGEGTWSLPSGEGGAAGVSVSIVVERPGAQPWVLFAGNGFFGMGDLMPASVAASGSFVLDTDLQGGDADVSVVDGATLDVLVDLVQSTPAQITIDLSGVPLFGG